MKIVHYSENIKYSRINIQNCDEESYRTLLKDITKELNL